MLHYIFWMLKDTLQFSLRMAEQNAVFSTMKTSQYLMVSVSDICDETLPNDAVICTAQI